jgi:UDP-2-acetamido-2,6-beta-L-arabino-hexul-4-ose reductase
MQTQQVMVTGASGFLGRHMVEALSRREGCSVVTIDRSSSAEELRAGLEKVDTIWHLAGVNRPKNEVEFETGNELFTRKLLGMLRVMDRRPTIVFSSSIQAILDNPYGRSKRMAEVAIEDWASETGSQAFIFRLPNLFGKWCRPNYNSVTATFCHNIARGLPLTVSDPARQLELAYVDDVVAAMVSEVFFAPVSLRRGVCKTQWPKVPRSFQITLGDLAARITAFREMRTNLKVPDFEDDLNRCLYATYLSHLDPNDFAYSLDRKCDSRGSLAEFVKLQSGGQIFVSRTGPGITRGNHYHHTKTEKFLVLEGEAVVRFRELYGTEIIEHRVDGRDFRVIDIPPGYTHSIENLGTGELVTLFWANEIFDPSRPDTYFLPVLPT